jgi:hypothetical protein
MTAKTAAVFRIIAELPRNGRFHPRGGQWLAVHALNDDERGGQEDNKVYNTRFRTDRGDIVLEYRNSSNGDFGGELVGPFEVA